MHAIPRSATSAARNSGNLCILYTANDAYMHDFRLFVPRDCIAAEPKDVNRQ